MTNNIAKIRAALESIRSCDDMKGERDAALAALAELEKAAAPQFVAGELSDTMARKLWREWFDASGITGVESAHFWLKALRRELGPALGLVEIREPDDDECIAINEHVLRAHGIEGCGAVLNGRVIFDAAAKWLKGEL